MSDWILVYYETATGQCPFEEYFDSLEPKEAAKLRFDLDLLETFGIRLGAPHVKNINGKLWELRTTGKHQRRVFYFAFTGKRLVILHAFTKKTPKTPKSEIKLAEKRMKDFLKRMKK